MPTPLVPALPCGPIEPRTLPAFTYVPLTSPIISSLLPATVALAIPALPSPCEP